MSSKAHHLYDPGELAALQLATDIDRRNGPRTVPLRVICLGVSRTGTTSLRQALIELGFGDCYHFSTIVQENPSDAGIWMKAVQGKEGLNGRKPFTKEDWDSLLGHCQSITDTPCTVFWQELLEMYPDAKVILTVRDNANQWFDSQMKTIVPFAAEVEMPGDGQNPINALTKMLFEHYDMYKTLWKDHNEGTLDAKRWYEDHIAAVQQRVPEDNLLIFNVKEGWQPLCAFLEVPAPDRPFPWRNDHVTFRKNMDDIKAFIESQTTSA